MNRWYVCAEGEGLTYGHAYNTTETGPVIMMFTSKFGVPFGRIRVKWDQNSTLRDTVQFLFHDWPGHWLLLTEAPDISGWNHTPQTIMYTGTYKF